MKVRIEHRCGCVRIVDIWNPDSPAFDRKQADLAASLCARCAIQPKPTAAERSVGDYELPTFAMRFYTDVIYVYRYENGTQTGIKVCKTLKLAEKHVAKELSTWFFLLSTKL